MLEFNGSEHGGNGAGTIDTPAWAVDATFYHVYPLGLLGAPLRNNGGESVMRLDRLHDWIPHIAGLGFTAIYLGPVFESVSHGYDTTDYFQVDRRLGDNACLKRLVDAFHRAGIKVVLDAVFNHVGRSFPAFRSVQDHGIHATERHWFKNLDFSRPSPAGDAFWYEGWHGHYDLVKLDTENHEVRAHLLSAARFWMEEFDIDGLRLDAADCLSTDFMKALAHDCRGRRKDFWLMGEVVHGDYRNWANEQTLHSTTNYEAYKGLWSSFNDLNFFEIDWTLKRQFVEGRYNHLALYNFVDNHDVERAASILTDLKHITQLYTLLFTIPGIPSVYYGSEWGIAGKKEKHSDTSLRPSLELGIMQDRERNGKSPQPELCAHISALTKIRRESASLRRGSYRQVLVTNRQFAFWRDCNGAALLVVFNASAESCTLQLPLGTFGVEGREFFDKLDTSTHCHVRGNTLQVTMPQRSARILQLI